MGNERQPNINKCIVKVVGCAGGAFIATAQCVDALVTHLFGPGAFWLIIAPMRAGFWAFEYFCVQGSDEE